MIPKKGPRTLLALIGGVALVAGITAPGCGGGCGGKAPLGYVPHDALVVFVIPSINELLQKQTEYLARFDDDPKVAKGLKDVTKQLKKNLGFDPTRPEALKAAGIDPGRGIAGGLSGDGQNLCFAMGVEDQDTLEKTLRKMAKKSVPDDKAEFKKVERDGVTVTKVMMEDSDTELMAWGYHKGHLISCVKAEDGDLADRVIKTANMEKSIKDNEHYKALSKRLSGQQLKVVVDGESLASFMEEWVDSRTSKMPKYRRKTFMREWNTLINAMDYFTGAVLGVKVSADDVLISTFWGVPPKEAKKLSKLFKGKGDDVTLAKYIGPDALAVVKMSINLKDYLDWQSELLPSEATEGLYQVLKNVKRETKIDVEEDILELLGGRFAVGYFLPSKKYRKKAKESSNPADKLRGAFDGVIIVQVTKAEDVEDLFKKIKKLAAEEGATVKRKTRGKRKEYSLRLGKKKVLAWTLVKDLAILGTPKRLAETIKLIEGGGDSVLDAKLSARGKKALEGEENTAFHFRLTRLSKKDLPKKLREHAKSIKKLSDLTFSMTMEEDGFRYELDGLGVMAAVAIPAFTKYINKSKTVEAVIALDKIKSGARQYYVTDHWNQNGELMPKRFPAVSKSGKWTPSKPCCGKKCNTSMTKWDKDGWNKLHFALTDSHYYQYQFIASESTGTSATYTARARGDLDCDGTYSTFEIRGSVDSEGAVKTDGPIITNETE